MAATEGTTDSITVNEHQISFNNYEDIPPHVRVIMHANDTWTENILMKFLDEVEGMGVEHDVKADDFIFDAVDNTICVNSRKENASQVLSMLPKMVQMRSYEWLDVGPQNETENAVWILMESGYNDREIEDILPSVNRFKL